jgi:hypothetical protein
LPIFLVTARKFPQPFLETRIHCKTSLDSASLE